MRAVVDTNVVAYFLLGTRPFVLEARRFWRAVGEPLAPALWEAELANDKTAKAKRGITDESLKKAEDRLSLM